jgi:hypothetical protein
MPAQRAKELEARVDDLRAVCTNLRIQADAALETGDVQTLSTTVVLALNALDGAIAVLDSFIELERHMFSALTEAESGDTARLLLKQPLMNRAARCRSFRTAARSAGADL